MLFRKLLPDHQIQRIRYFTARVQPRPSDPEVHVRQQTYLRALATLPNLSLHFGTFRHGVRSMKLANPVRGLPSYVDVLRSEEKGSDVNLASHLLMDSFRNDFDVAVVVSNDTDLVEPIRMVRREMGRPVGLLNPHPKPARDLLREVSFYKLIRRGPLRDSQFAPALRDASGTFHKPRSW